MEKLLELDSITLIPSVTNNGWTGAEKFNYLIKDPFDITDSSVSFPIITSPMDSIISESNWNIWRDNYIKPVLPRTVDLKTRIEACHYIWAAFSLEEIVSEFINSRALLNDPGQFHVCIDSGNGHDRRVLSLGAELMRRYNPDPDPRQRRKMLLMAGNIDNPQTFIEYSKLRFDYVRVGMSSSSLVNKKKFGFHYPMASLLCSIQTLKTTSGIGLFPTKIIADGGIKCCSDILKAIALGADYVMIGREFVKILEAAGTLYIKGKDKDGKPCISEFSGPLENIDLSRKNLVRLYQGNTTLEVQAIRNGISDFENWKRTGKHKMCDSKTVWVDVDKTLYTWLNDFNECAKYGFMMAGATDWLSFKKNVFYGSID